MLPEAGAVLREGRRQLRHIEGQYQDSLNAKAVSTSLQAVIKNLVENQRSALEYLAHAITDRYGKRGKRTYWPVATAASDFGSSMDSNMPGVAASRPDIAAAIELRQPYQPGFDWIRALVDLTNENKHRRLSPQTRTTHTRRFAGGGGVSWDPSAVRFGGPGVFIGGEHVDPATQRTASSYDVIYVDWLFSELQVSALQTLARIQDGVEQVAHDISSLAAL